MESDVPLNWKTYKDRAAVRRAELELFSAAAAQHGIAVERLLSDHLTERIVVKVANCAAQVRITIQTGPYFNGTTTQYKYEQIDDGCLNAVLCNGKLDSWFILPYIVEVGDQIRIPHRRPFGVVNRTEWVWQFRENWDLLKESRPGQRVRIRRVNDRQDGDRSDD